MSSVAGGTKSKTTYQESGASAFVGEDDDDDGDEQYGEF